MALSTALPSSGNTAWYTYAGALHDAAGVSDGAIIVASAGFGTQTFGTSAFGGS
jgi:hypothetical protein